MDKLKRSFDLTVSGSVPVNRHLIQEHGLEAAVFFGELLSRQIYYRKAGELNREGYFYYSRNDAHRKCGLTRRAQERALEVLSALGLVTKKDYPGQARRFKVDPDAAIKLLDSVQNEPGIDANPVQSVPTTRYESYQDPGTNRTTSNSLLTLNNTYTLWNNLHQIKAEPNKEVDQLILDVTDKHGEKTLTQAIRNYKSYYNPDGRYYSVALPLRKFLENDKFKDFLPGGTVHESMKDRQDSQENMSREELLAAGKLHPTYMTRREKIERNLIEG